MATAPPTRLLTAAEFAARPRPDDGSVEELVGGVVVTAPPRTFRHGLVRGNAGAILLAAARRAGSGRVTLGTGLVTATDPDTVRGPDASYWSYDRLPAECVPLGYPDVAADLVAEVVSPSNTRKRLAAKVREYFSTGVRLVWVIDPDDRTVTVYSKPGEGTVLWDDATLAGGDVLPGFACPVAELFGTRPTTEGVA